MKRRAWLKAAGAYLLTRAHTPEAAAKTKDSAELQQVDLKLEGDARVAKRALLLVPKHGAPQGLLLLLHGLGETGNELLGIHAWGERYGLVRAYERLRQPPVRAESKFAYLSAERSAELDVSLARDAFDGLALVCPVTPNPYKGGASVLDRYAEWIEAVLLPSVRQHLAPSGQPLSVGLDGCSLGGYVGLELLLRRPELFQSFGVVQAAIASESAASYARRLAQAISRRGPLPIHIETSSGDPYKKACQRLSEELLSLGVPNQFRVSNGPHDQVWLRDVGTLEMLLWHERQLKEPRGTRRGKAEQ